MNRADALTYLQARFNDLYGVAGRGVNDDAAGYKSVIDEALEAVPIVPATGHIAAGAESRFRAVLQYLAYDLVIPRLAAQIAINIQNPGISLSLQQRYAQASKERDNLRTIIAGWGIKVGGAEGAGASYTEIIFEQPAPVGYVRAPHVHYPLDEYGQPE